MRRAVLVICWVATGCTSLAGLDGLSFEASGGGGGTTTGGGGGASSSSSSTSGGSGGTGGAGGTMEGGAAPTEISDWSTSLLAVYDFELDGDLGVGTPGPTLSPVGTPQPGPAQVGAQGAHFAALGDRLEGDDSALHLPMGSGLALSAWVKIDGTNGGGATEIIANYDEATATGFSLDRVDGNRLSCFVGNGTEFLTAQSALDSFPLGVWKHIGCVYDSEVQEIRTYLDGLLVDIAVDVAPFLGTPGPLAVPSANYPFAGHVDEAVMHDAALHDASILRIYACGVSGASCTCDRTDPTQYDSCGRLEPNCPATLPACNAPEP